MSEPANPAKRKRIWEDNNDATPPPSAQRVKIKDRLSINNLIEDRLSIKQLLNGKEGSGKVASTPGSSPSQTPSGKHVKLKPKRNNRGKHLPPGFRPGHVSSTNSKRTGLFSPEEIETLEQFKLAFCSQFHITADMFDASVQSAQKIKGGIFLLDTPPIEYKKFWQEIYGQIPDRDQKSINRFCRRHFSNAYKPHQWTTADDDELERLHSIYGTKWAVIARDMERTYDDVVQRWKNKVELRHTMKLGPWDDDEINKLIECLEHTRNLQLSKLERTEEDIGKDIYELPDECIAWGRISDRFQHTRSRQQVADKWRKIKRIVLERRADGYEDAVWEPSIQPKPGPRPKYRPLPLQSEKRGFISNETVDSSDDAEDQDGGQNEKEKENGNKQQPAKANGTLQSQANESANESSDSSSEDDSDDESSSDKENNEADNGDESDEDEVVNESADETPRPQTNGHHEASDDESVVPESQVEESQASSSRSPSPDAETNGHAASGRQPSEELGVDPVTAQEAPEADEDSENADEDVEPPTSQAKPAEPAKSPIIKGEERHSSPSDSGSDSDSDDESRDGSSDSSSDSSDEESEEELSPEEIEKKIFKFKKEPEDD
jgi:hypothetical protein